MSHASRKKSESGFYHVVVKGDGGQIIFESNSDRRRFLGLLRTAIEECSVELHAYCLMDNHVHLLLRDTDDKLSICMKMLNESYAQYFSKVTGRVGHVFQGRFWSEPVLSDDHFLAAVRYIHANPETACMCEAKDYPWSSFGSYARCAKGGTANCSILDVPTVETSLALSLLDGVEAFERFSQSGSELARPFPGSKLSKHLSSDELASVALNVLGRNVLNGLRTMGPLDRAPYLVKLSQAGFTNCEIARITGLGRSTISRTMKSECTLGDCPQVCT